MVFLDRPCGTKQCAREMECKSFVAQQTALTTVVSGEAVEGTTVSASQAVKIKRSKLVQCVETARAATSLLAVMAGMEGCTLTLNANGSRTTGSIVQALVVKPNATMTIQSFYLHQIVGLVEKRGVEEVGLKHF